MKLVLVINLVNTFFACESDDVDKLGTLCVGFKPGNAIMIHRQLR